MKDLGLPVSEKKNFEVCLLVPMFKIETPGAGPVLNKTGKGPQGGAIYQI